MCIFTGEVESVGDTRIFARQEAHRQAIVYDMVLSSNDETAMVLPIPIADSTSADQVEFVDLSGFSTFFDDIESLFPQWMSASVDALSSRSLDLIEVQEVGVYEASFVPTPGDFRRLDPRFSLNDTFFEQAPEYSDYGFVVFKLKPGESRVHPMAFWFSKINDNQLFFPTKHMHDGIVHSSDDFSHTLYGQCDAYSGVDSTLETINPENHLDMLNSIARNSLGLVSLGQMICKKTMYGKNDNKDVWLSTE